jgi:hypothetical protein
MEAQVLLALALTLASTCALNWGYLREHRAASKLPPLSVKRPIASLRLLLCNSAWLIGFLWETLGFGLYVAALALAPLALVQAVAAGGIGVLALLVARVGGESLGPGERRGVAISLAGLVLLGISLAGGSGEGTDGSWLLISPWLGASAAAAALAIGSGATALGGGAAFGLAAGVLFAAGDVATKAAVSGGNHVVVAPTVVAFYAAGTIVLQMGFQRGRALTTAGIATLATNAIPIAAAMTLFAEPLPAGPLGVVRVLSFAAVVAGAAALAPGRAAKRARSGMRLSERAAHNSPRSETTPSRGSSGRQTGLHAQHGPVSPSIGLSRAGDLIDLVDGPPAAGLLAYESEPSQRDRGEKEPEVA